MNLKLIICTMMLLFSCLLGNAQQKYQSYETSPLWIAMIDDTTVNFNEAVKAYEIYWKHRVKPLQNEFNHVVNVKMKVSESKEVFNNSSKIDLAFEQEMKYQCKRFEQWKLEVSPLVQPGGRILTEKEQDEMYQHRNFSGK